MADKKESSKKTTTTIEYNEETLVLEERKVKLVSLNASMPDKETLKLNMVIRKPADLGMDHLINMVNGMDEAKSMEIN